MVFNIIFNSPRIRRFKQEDLVSVVENYMSENDIDRSNSKLVTDDVSAFIRTYVPQKNETPEDNMTCPLSRLGLLKEESGYYSFCNPSGKKLDYLAVYYCMLKFAEKRNIDEVNIDDLINADDSPVKPMNIDKNLMFSYLNEMQHKGLLTVNRTAGLNMIYFDKKADILTVFDTYFKGA